MEVTSEIRKEVLKLMQEKEKLEDEIKELTSILTRVSTSYFNIKIIN